MLGESPVERGACSVGGGCACDTVEAGIGAICGILILPNKACSSFFCGVAQSVPPPAVRKCGGIAFPSLPDGPLIGVPIACPAVPEIAPAIAGAALADAACPYRPT